MGFAGYSAEQESEQTPLSLSVLSWEANRTSKVAEQFLLIFMKISMLLAAFSSEKLDVEQCDVSTDKETHTLLQSALYGELTF